MSEIDPQGWAALTRGCLYDKYWWLLANEPTLAGQQYITIEEADDATLRSAFVWQAMAAQDPSPYYNIVGLLRRFHALAPEQEPGPGSVSMNCTGVGLHSPVLVSAETRITEELIRSHMEIAAEANGKRPSAWGVNFVEGANSQLSAALTGAGFHEYQAYQRSVLTLSGSCFDDYVNSISSQKRRWGVRRDRRLFAETGQSVAFASGPGAMAEDLVRLQGLNKEKYGQGFDPDESRERMSSLLTAAGDDGIVIRSMLGERCTGFVLFFRGGNTLHALSAGFEESQARISPYFECLFYAPIELCYAAGIHVIDFGVGSMNTKVARGCDTVDLSAWALIEPACL